MRNLALLLVIALSAAPPAAGQTTLGVRAGVGSAWMGTLGNVDFSPCPPDTDCPAAADSAVWGLTLGVDFDISVSKTSDMVGIRFGAAYTEKGGAGHGYDAKHEPDSGTISMGYLQFSALLRVRASNRPVSVNFLAGPWFGSQLSCEKEGDLGVSCGTTDGGIAIGAGVEIALPSSPSASVGLEGVYQLGLREHRGGYAETTRFAAIQLGFAYKIG